MTLRLDYRAVACGLLAVLTLLAMPAQAHPGLHHDIQRLTDAIEQDPTNATLFVQRAHYLRLHGDLEGSLADLDQAQRIDADDLDVALGRGQTLSAMGRDAEAEASLDRFIGGGGSAEPAFVSRAEVRARAGRLDEAIADYTRALALKLDVENYLARGALQETTGDLAAAAAGYEDGLRQLGGAVTLRLALIRVQTARGEFDAALSLVDQELDNSSVKTDWYLRRADVLRAAKRDAEAERTLDLALAEADRVLGRRSTGIKLFSRARVYLAQGRVDEARNDLAEVLRISPRFAQARELLDQLQADDTIQGD